MQPAQYLPRLWIFGATARAAARSARLAGFAPVAADRFADADLQAAAWWQLWDVGAIPSAANRSPAAGEPWIYVGPLENHPRWIAARTRERVADVSTASATPLLWGNSGQPLRRVRDPWTVARVASAAGLDAPQLSRSPTVPAGRWLRKSTCSGGGAQVRWAQKLERRDQYWQTHRDGAPHSAVFVIDAQSSRLVGVTRQLTGERWGAPRGSFLYCGSIGPIEFGPSPLRQLRQLGELLGPAGLGLKGLVGVDLMVSGAPATSPRISVLEINPRYTASVEIHERASSVAWLAEHARCWGHEPVGPPAELRPATASPAEFHGKIVVYAPVAGPIDSPTASRLWRWAQATQAPAAPQAADIPHLGSWIERGHPICTLFAAGPSTEAVERQLTLRSRELLGAWHGDERSAFLPTQQG